MTYDGYFAFGGTEVINAARTAAYVAHEMPTFGLSNCVRCEDLRLALGDDPYTTPLVDAPAWFDERNPDSWNFYGLYPLSVEGIEDSTVTSTVTQLTGDGAVMSAPRHAGREISFSALLIGADDAAVSYGLTWLRSALEGSPCRPDGACTGDHLCFYSACPPVCTDADPTGSPKRFTCEDGQITATGRWCALDYERTMYRVTVTDGPTIVERYNTSVGSMIRVQWTVTAGVPWAYSTAIKVVDSDGTGSVTAGTVTSDISCKAGTTSTLRVNWAPNPNPTVYFIASGGWDSADVSRWQVGDPGAVHPPVRHPTVSYGMRQAKVVRQVVAPNQVTNSQPTTADGWGWKPWVSGVPVQTVSWAVNGTGAGPAGSTGYISYTIDAAHQGGASGPRYTQSKVLPVGSQYTAAMWVRAPSTTTVRLALQYGTATTALTSVDGPDVELVANTWTLLGPLTAPVPAKQAVFRITAAQTGAAISPARIDVARATLVPGTWLVDPTIALFDNVGQDNADPQGLALVQGAQYTASVYVSALVPAKARINVLMTMVGEPGGPREHVVSGPWHDLGASGTWAATTGAGWSRVQATFTPTFDKYARLQVEIARADSGGAQVGDLSWISDLLVEQGSVAQSYFDGSFTDRSGYDYRWEGGDGASRSLLRRTIPNPVLTPVIDPGCPVVPAAPKPPQVAVSCLTTPTQWRRYAAVLPDDLLPAWRDVVPIVRIRATGTDVSQARIRFYPNPFGAPIEELDPCEFCGEFVISYIPGGSLMVIDGIRNTAQVEKPNGSIQPANHLLYATDGGPMVWPLLTCGIGYTVVIDAYPTTVPLRSSVCLAARE